MTQILLTRWHAGEQGALNDLLELHLPWIRGYVRRRLGPVLRKKLDTADVVQEAVMEFLQHGPRFQVSDGDQFRRLMAHIAENVLGHQYEWFTAQRRTIHRERPLPADEVLDLDRPGVSSPSSATAHQREREAWVRLALELITPEDREAIVLRDWQGLSLAEVGKRLGVSPDAARKRYDRAMLRLAKRARQLRSGRLTACLEEQEADRGPVEP